MLFKGKLLWPPCGLPQSPVTPSLLFPLPSDFFYPLLFSCCTGPHPFPQTGPLPAHMSSALWAHCGLQAPLPCPLAAGRKPFPSPSTLFPSVTPSTHGIISLGSRCPAVKETDPSWPEGGRKGGGEMIPKWKSPPPPRPGTLRNGKGVHWCHWIWKGVRKQITEKLTPKQPWATAPQSVKSLWTELHLSQIHILKHSEAPNI